MTVQGFNKTGSKYLRSVRGMRDGHVDVYAVIETFDVRCPATQHALKKLLCAGLRGKNSRVADLEEAKDAILRAIELEKDRGPADIPQIMDRDALVRAGFAPAIPPSEGLYPSNDLRRAVDSVNVVAGSLHRLAKSVPATPTQKVTDLDDEF